MSTTRSTPDASSADAAWAREQLGLPDRSDEATMRAALCRQLRSHEFLPPSDWQTCALSVIRPAEERPGTASAVSAGRRDALREQVETFAGDFFSIEPTARRTRYTELLLLCAGHAPLVARLETLAPGLDLCAASLPAEVRIETSQLQAELLRLLVQRPAARAATLLELRAQWASDRQLWEHAARQLEYWSPELACFSGALIRELKFWRAAEYEESRILRKQQRALKKQASADSRTSGSWSLIVLICFGVAVGISRLSLPDKNQQQPTNVYNYRSPAYDVDEMMRKAYQKIQDKKLRDALKPRGIGHSAGDNLNEPDAPQPYIGDALRRLYGLPPNEPANSPASPAPPQNSD